MKKVVVFLVMFVAIQMFAQAVPKAEMDKFVNNKEIILSGCDTGGRTGSAYFKINKQFVILEIKFVFMLLINKKLLNFISIK